MVLAQGFRTSQLLLDEEKGVSQRRFVQQIVHAVKVHFRNKVSVRKSVHEVKNGNVMKEGMRSPDDVEFGFRAQERSYLFQVRGNVFVDGKSGIGNLPRNIGVIQVFQTTSQIFVLEDSPLLKQIKSGDIGRVLLHKDNVREGMRKKLVSIGRGSGKMNNTNLFSLQIVDIHESSVKKGLMNGLVEFEGDLIFINDNEDVGQTLDSPDKGMKLVAMKDTISQMWRETLFGLFHPFHRRETGNEEYMVVRAMLNETEHRACFA